MPGHDKKKALLQSAFWTALLAGGIIVWLGTLGAHDGNRSWRALLVNFLYFTPLCAGLAAWSAGLALSRAKWAGPLEATLLRGIGFALPSLIALVGLRIGCRSLYPWGAHRTTVEGFWLDPNFVFIRDGILLAGFWTVALFYSRRRRKGGGVRSAGLLSILYVAVFSMPAFDLAMSLTPPWKSTVYGLYFVVSGLYVAVAAWTFSAALNGSASKKQFHDLGKLLVGMSLLAAYLMLCQVLTLWYENIPRETGFLLQRLYPASWRWIGFALICSVYIGPLILLLPKRFKQHRWYLGGIACLVLAGMWLERFWLVVPSFGVSPKIGPPEIALTTAFIGAMGIVFTLFKPRILETEDPESRLP